MANEMSRDFKGVWIPKEIWLNEELGWTEKLLLVEIDSLQTNKQCFATNEYFANFFGLSKDRISKIISRLKKLGYIEVNIEYKPNTKQIDKRVITTIGYRRKQLGGIVENTEGGIGKNTEGGIGENAEDINIDIINTDIINTTINTSKKESKEEKYNKNNSENESQKNEDKKTFNEIIEEYAGEEKELENKLKAFIQMRFRNGNPITNKVLYMLLDKLEKYSRGNIILKLSILEQSLICGRPDLYPAQKTAVNNYLNFYDEDNFV